MKKTKIDWCDSTWNPVTGCNHGCDYCYARKMAERFGGKTAPGRFVLQEEARKPDGSVLPYPYGFAPTLHEYRLQIPKQWSDAKTIFVCSMADLFGEWVPDEWIERVLESCKAAPQHRYLFLTKNPNRYIELATAGKLPEGDSYWYGTTVTDPDQPFFWSKHHNAFVSIEPILEEFVTVAVPCRVGWVIVGAETGRRAGKVQPQRNWIRNIVQACTDAGTPLFMKSSLTDLMEGKLVQEYPWPIR